MRDDRGAVRAARLASALLALAVLAACGDEQDPGVSPGDGSPQQTSDTLGTCPAGGPDATTPPAGCIDDAGRVQRP